MPSWSQQLQDIVTAILPGWLKTIVEKGLLRAFAALVAVVVVLPPVLVLLAAFWLNLLGGVNLSFVRGVRESYIQFVEQGFSLEELATRSNARLDYLQNFEFDLDRTHSPNRVWHLSLHRFQKAAIIFRTLGFTSDGPTCTLPESDLKLIDVYLGPESLRTLHADESNVDISISKQWWTVHASSLTDADVDQLKFSLAQPVRDLKCGRVHIEGAVEVFKDDLQAP